MLAKPSNAPFRASLAFALCACLAGCVIPIPIPVPSPKTSDTTAPILGEIKSAQAAKDAITIGKSTKTDVIAALGKPVVVNFDSGYEVWVYRENPQQKPPPDKTASRARTELVVLFAPSGVVTKARIRADPAA
jgi:outer membrane protein assembly factor BamE (lipoprotein component of BamABCDE complex)